MYFIYFVLVFVFVFVYVFIAHGIDICDSYVLNLHIPYAIAKGYHAFAAQGWRNHTLISHERVDSRILVLPGSESISTEITAYIFLSLILTAVEFRYKID